LTRRFRHHACSSIAAARAGGRALSVAKEAAMTEREFFLDRREAESGAFHRVLDALPKEPARRPPQGRGGVRGCPARGEARHRGAQATFARAGGDRVLGLTP
jgi:hypothetical protein